MEYGPELPVLLISGALVAVLVHSLYVWLSYRTAFHFYLGISVGVILGSTWVELLVLGGCLWCGEAYAAATTALAAPFLWTAASRLVGEKDRWWVLTAGLVAGAVPLALVVAGVPSPYPEFCATLVSGVLISHRIWRSLPEAGANLGRRTALLGSWFALALALSVRPLWIYFFGSDMVSATMVPASLYIVAIITMILYFDIARLTKTAGFNRLQVLLSSPTDVVYSYRFKQRRGFEFISPSIMGWTGVTAEEVCRNGLSMLKAIHPEDRQRVKNRLFEDYVETEPHTYRFITPDGSIRWGEQRNVPVFNGKGEVVGLEGVMRDVTAGILQQRALAESEERYRTLFNSGGDMVFVATLDGPMGPGRMVAVNDAAVLTLGYSREDLLQMNADGLVVLENQEAGEEAIDKIVSGQDVMLSMSLRTRSGALVPVEVHGHPVVVEGQASVIAVARDVSERRDLEARLVQAQKMEAMGRLAGGVAHDFNNVLSAIIGNADLLSLRLPEDHVLRPEVDHILEASERAARLVRQLLVFSRKQPLKRRILQLNDLLTGMVPLIQSLIGERIRLTLDLDETLGLVKADPVQLEQVVLNLVVNARDAMANGGALDISTKVHVLTVATLGGTPAGEYALLTVRDTGHGISEDDLGKVFEPFFTTKEDGTGLGLATVYGILQRMQGEVEVESVLARGTTFRVMIPVAEPGESSSDSNWRLTSSSLPPPVGNETILVVDDEPDVLNVADNALQQLGYTVLAAATGEEAEAIVRGYPGEIHLLLSDVILPRVSGPVLAKRLCVQRPDMKVLLMSGYSDGYVEDGKESTTAFIPKPFSVGELARKVRRVLERP